MDVLQAISNRRSYRACLKCVCVSDPLYLEEAADKMDVLPSLTE